MTVIVTDEGFAADDWTGDFVPLHEAGPGTTALDLAPDTDLAELAGRLGGVEMIRVAFESFADGRGLTIARQLRLSGYTRRLRASGHIIADQYGMARRAGFDEIEISAELAARQPSEQWLFRSDWRENDYQARLRG